MDYVTDTHSLVWYFTENTHLSKNARDAFEETIEHGMIIIPAIVLAEIMFISKKGKTAFTFNETLKKIEEYENFNTVPLDANIINTADKIPVDMEMHDKLIVATALYFNAALITKDDLIKKSKIVTTVW